MKETEPAKGLASGAGGLATIEEPMPAILLVDDDRRNRTLIKDYLGDAFQVHQASNGREALELLSQLPIDLVLLDVMMPEMSGFDACRAIRQRDATDFLPVILLTALNEQEDRNAGLMAGADDFLTKPVDRRELLLRVKAFLKMRHQEAVIRKQLEDLRQLQALKDDLVSLIVHDVRNPLMGVQGFLELLQRRFAKTDQKDVRVFLDRACDSAARLREILEDMLKIRLLEQGELTLDCSLVEIEELAAGAITTLEGAAKAAMLEVRLSVDPGSPVSVDRKLAQRAIENLLANAVKYSPSASPIEIATRNVDGGREVEIADRGPGIPDTLKTEIFERFGSVEAKRETSRRGYGLGLFLVKLVMAAHGGHVSVHDRDGGGSAFRLFFPASPR